MLGFRVALADGTSVLVEATHYSVDDDGTLVVFVADTEVRRFSAWIEVRNVGTRLASTWPPDDLEQVLDQLHLELGRFGACDPLGRASSFHSPLLNELDAFVAEVLDRVGLDATASEHRREMLAVRGLVRRRFSRWSPGSGSRLPPGPRRPG